MDKNYFRSLIKHYFLKGKTAKETKEKLDKYYVANAPSDYTVKYWFREFRGGRNSTTDEIRSGRPSDNIGFYFIKINYVINTTRYKLIVSNKLCRFLFIKIKRSWIK
ncbi:SETMR methyltransferase, partial [Acromyrmex insinuator]